MGILCSRLLALLNGTDPNSTSFHIAMVMLENMDQLAGLSIGALAELCSVSKSRISRFVRELGYEEFADFHYAVRFEDNRFRPQYAFVKDVVGYLESHSYQDYIREITADLSETADSLDLEALDRFLEALHTYQSVAAFGHMFSETAAMDFQSKLARMGKFVLTHLDDQLQSAYIKHADTDTLVIVFSDSGTFMDRYEMIDKETGQSVFNATKGHIVMITSNPKMCSDPRVDDVLLYSRTGTLHTHRLMYSLVTDIIAQRYYSIYKRPNL